MTKPKWILFITASVLWTNLACAQKSIHDQSIVYQQERMVFKQWDRNKFTPKKGFLGLNPLYWITWGLHPNYPKNDLRPLSGSGNQTQRIGLAIALSGTDDNYRKQSDTVRNTSLSEALYYSGSISEIDPLWALYYQGEFSGLMDSTFNDIVSPIPWEEKDYLNQIGVLDWYAEEREILLERLQASKSTAMPRGSRMLTYNRLLYEYRNLESVFSAKRRNASLFLSLMKTQKNLSSGNIPISIMDSYGNDIKIAEDILTKIYSK